MRQGHHRMRCGTHSRSILPHATAQHAHQEYTQQVQHQQTEQQQAHQAHQTHQVQPQHAQHGQHGQHAQHAYALLREWWHQELNQLWLLQLWSDRLGQC